MANDELGNPMTKSTFHKLFNGKLFSRRHFLTAAALGGGALLMGYQRLSDLLGNDEVKSNVAAIDMPTTENESSSLFAEESQPADTLRIAFDNQPQEWEPATFATVPSYQFGLAIYDGLVWVDRNLTPQPALATSWTTSPDGLTWTFSLRQGVQFHHGLEFTAKDVVHSFERLLDPKQASPIRAVISFIDSIEEIEDGTATGGVRFNLKAPNGDLTLLCGAPQASIVSHDYSANMFAANPSGTGPFRFVELIPNERVVLQKNDRYWDEGTVQLKEVHHVYIESMADQIKALGTGAIDLIPDMGAKDVASLVGQSTIDILQGVGGAYHTVVMQATEEPFTDIRVRKALKICLDRSAIQDRVLGGQGEIANDHPVVSFSPFVTEMSEPGPDIDEARTLLAEAGYPKGLKLDLITSTSRPGMVELAEAVRDLAAPAGFKIAPTLVPADVYWEAYWRKVPFHISSWNFLPSIDETLTTGYHSESVWNEGFWKNPEFDALIEEARGETEPDERKALYEQAQHILAEDGAVIIPYFRPIFSVINKRIEGFRQHPAGWLNMLDVTAVGT